MPSRCTIRGGGGSSTTGSAAPASVAFVIDGQAGHARSWRRHRRSLGRWRRDRSVGLAESRWSSAALGVGGFGVTAAIAVAGASCFRYCAATNAKAFAGGFDFRPVAFGVDLLHRRRRAQAAKHAVVFARAAAHVQLSSADRLVGRVDEGVLTQTCAFGGSAIFAQADGSSGPELFSMISSITVTGSPLVTRVDDFAS